MDELYDAEFFSFFDVDDEDLFGVDDLAADSFHQSGNSSSTGQATSSHSGGHHKKSNDKSNTDSIRNVNNPKIFIPKSDKRRGYAKIFADAFNSCDVKTIFKYLETYCIKDCLLIQQCIGKENPFIPKYIEVLGINAILEFWRTLFMTVPDALMVMLESKLRVKHVKPQVVALGGTESQKGERTAGADTVEVSCIVSSFSFTGTKLYQLTSDNAVLEPARGSAGAQAVTNGAASSSSSNAGAAAAAAANGKDGLPQLSAPPQLEYTESIAQATAAAAAEITVKKTKKRPLEVTAGELLRDISAKYNPMPGTVHQSSILPNGANLAQTISNLSVINKIMPSGNARYKEKASNYMLINSNTRLAAGDLILPANSHLDFLGTLNMYLDGEMRIVKFEFVYSPTD